MKMINGQPFKAKQNVLYIERCCDCGLVHQICYRVVGKQIEVVTYRDDYLTHKAHKKKRKNNETH